MATKKTTTSSKKPRANKKQNTKSLSSKKTSNNKNKTAKKSVLSKKPSSAKNKSNKKTNIKTKKETKSNVVVTKKISNSNKKVVANNKKVVIEYYSCLRKYYLVKDKKTGIEKQKRIWIVIGDNHKWYRKFETQIDAINYFRNLKKYAKMRVQSAKSKQFIKTIYTFILMEYQGINVNEIIKKIKNQPTKEYSLDEDFEDEFSEFDVIENDEYENFDHEKVDKIITEKEKDIVVFDDTQNIDSFSTLNEQIENEEYLSLKQENTQILNVTKEIELDDSTKTDLYELTQESNLNYEDINDQQQTSNVLVQNQEIIEKDQNQQSLNSIQKEIKELDNDKLVLVNDNDNQEITMTRTNSNLYDIPSNETKTIDTELKPSIARTIIYWSVVALICAILTIIIVFSIYYATTKYR